jgi:hypothetical protein
MAAIMTAVILMRTGQFREVGDIEDVLVQTGVQAGYKGACPLSNIMVKAYNAHRASIVKTMRQVLAMLEHPNETDLSKYTLGSYTNSHVDLQHMQMLVREMKGLFCPNPASAFYIDGTLLTDRADVVAKAGELYDSYNNHADLHKALLGELPMNEFFKQSAEAAGLVAEVTSCNVAHYVDTNVT